jgi:Cof subfamily protein (haloacid dehalogenase superfamily)
MSIKLIATDVDGTLVKDSSREVYDELIEVVRLLTDRGYQFVVASGRQYGSIRRMFERADCNLHYIAENGAHIILNGENYAVTRMNPEDVKGIMADLRALYPQGCHVVASTAKGCYLESKDSAFIRLITEEYRNDVTLTDDILGEGEDIIKLAIYKQGSIRSIGESVLIPKWQNRVKTTMAGEEWVDFMDKSVDKGNALRRIQEVLGIKREETMVFGDNNNDLGLILAAEESYAVENAVDELKAAAKHICSGYTQKGVYQVLKQLVYKEEM